MRENPPPSLRVLVLSTLFPDVTRPHLAPFVVRQTRGLGALPDISVRVIAPLPLPPFPFGLHPTYAVRHQVPHREIWDGLDVHRLRFNPWPMTRGRFAAASLTRVLLPMVEEMRREFPFDVIAAEYFYPDGPTAIALGKAFNVPVSIKARGADIHFWGTKGSTADQVRAAGIAANGLLAVSESLRADMVALGMPGDHIRLHYTGVDLSLFAPAERSTLKSALGASGQLIACVGALIPRKGQKLLLEALRGVPNAHLIMIGDGPDRAALQAQAKRLGVADRVRFLGHLPQPEIARWLAAADVMALPSQSEGLANVWLEALACGTPIVISPAGGAAEVLRDEKAGRIVPRNPAAVAEAIREVLHHPPAQEACRAVAARFSWSRNAEVLRDHLLLLAGK